MDGTFALWVGLQPVFVGGQSIHQRVAFAAQALRRCHGLSRFAIEGFFWGSRVVIPSVIEGIFTVCSFFLETFTFSADVGFLASNGCQEEEDAFGDSRVVIPWAFFGVYSVTFGVHGVKPTSKPFSSDFSVVVGSQVLSRLGVVIPPGDRRHLHGSHVALFHNSFGDNRLLRRGSRSQTFEGCKIVNVVCRAQGWSSPGRLAGSRRSAYCGKDRPWSTADPWRGRIRKPHTRENSETCTSER